MSVGYYRLLLGVAASVSLLVGCGGNRDLVIDPVAGTTPPPAQTAARDPRDANEPDTEATLLTVLGLAKPPSQKNIGPQTGDQVSPVLWQAALETLKFAGTTSEDPMTGLLVTDWYSPSGKPQERLRVSVFILSRALRSDSVTVTVDRQEQGRDGQWRDTSVARDVVTGLENAILQRARQIHVDRRRQTM